jgi:hypothetical protein
LLFRTGRFRVASNYIGETEKNLDPRFSRE